MIAEATQHARPFAGHFTQTELRAGGDITATCPCGWSKPAASHEHSVQLGQEHQIEEAVNG